MKSQYRQSQSNQQKKKRPISVQMQARLREGFFLFTVACAAFLFISLISYHANDPSWSSTGLGASVANWGGRVGAWLADVFLSLFGVVAYIFPFLAVFASWLGLHEEKLPDARSYEWVFKLLGWIILIGSSCGLVRFYFHSAGYMPADTGGIIGDLLGRGMSACFNTIGSTILFVALLLGGITLVTGFSWLGMIGFIYNKLKQFFGYLIEKIKRAGSRPLPFKFDFKFKKTDKIVKQVTDRQEPSLLKSKVVPIVSKVAVTTSVKAPVIPKKKAAVNSKVQLKAGELPPFSLLDMHGNSSDKAFNDISLDALSELVEQRLADFGVTAKVTGVLPGPVITRFELDLAPGIKVSKIAGLAKDIARSLSVVSVRVVEVIPGKSVIGLEIPNENRDIVSLREVFESERYEHARSPISLALGKDISGEPVVVDLAKMPHLLVAGTTGSGKSVSLNSMLISMLYKATPDQLRLILIDPKMLELSVYDGIPHLLTPVITDMKEATNALRWCVAEMDRRYRLMASLGVRNLAGYNQKVNEAMKKGEPIPMPGALVTNEETAKMQLEPLPTIVLIADELADMMMVVGKKVEDLIARLAQKARAAGIHLILATQRPSVDVITGLIKANIPTRIAFQVSSRIDSRTILDQQGAEQLLGHGDMLYLPPGAGVPTRVHGAYLSDDEVHRVVAAWRTCGEPDYLNEVTQEAMESNAGDEQGGELDPLYDQAVRIVTDSRRASISLIQRRLRIGYNRAARMMEDMEAAGVVSSADNSGSRDVLAGEA